MTPRVQLLVSEWCAPCRGAEILWQEIARCKAIDLSVLDVAQIEGRELAAKLGIRTIPATVIDGELRFVGIPDRTLALAAIAHAEDRLSAGPRQIGITLMNSSAWAIVAAALYLGIAGAALVWGGGFRDEGLVRVAVLHGLGLGFFTLMIFGLAEHMLPRFTNSPIRVGWVGWSQQALVHAGTVLLVAGESLGSRGLVAAGGFAALSSYLVFTVRLLPVLIHDPPSG